MHQLLPDSDALMARFGDLLESVPDALVMSDAAGRILMTNKQAEELFGYGSGELSGKAIDILVPERFRTAHQGQLENYSAHPRKRSMGAGLDLFGLRKDGSEFPADISLSPLRINDALVVMSAIRDISDQKRIQKELQARNTALEAANQELQAFSYSVSHDLRAPLRAMDGFAAILKKSLGPHPQKETAHALQRLHENILKMQSLIDGLLDFSSLAWMALTKKLIDPRELVTGVFEDLKAAHSSRRVELKVGILGKCKADPVLLRQVFANLLSNAFKFTRDRDPATIHVGCRHEKGEHIYFVEDNGAGFDMDYVGKLFHVFQRLHSPAEFEGTGVGLAIVHRIVQRHGGRVWAVGEVDRGATFYFTLGESGDGLSS